MTLLDQVASLLRTRRESLGLSQRELGERMGVSRQAISQWESGCNLRLSTLVKLAEALDCRVDIRFIRVP